MSIDFRKCLYALSDVVMNRPPPLRIFDQIYMKLPDMLLQAEMIGRWFDDKEVVFIGDGDAIALTVVHLGKQELIRGLPRRIHVLDFDERIVLSIQKFARINDLSDLITAELYNVADPVLDKHCGSFDAFYTNPPWGSFNDGISVIAFVTRGIECVKSDALGCIVIGDHPDYPWTHEVLTKTQGHVFKEGFQIAEMLPCFHKYHLDDNPDLTSCSLLIRRKGIEVKAYDSKPLPEEDLENFYGYKAPLRAQYIKDLCEGGKYLSRDVKIIPLGSSLNGSNSE